tara:strand:+ start:119 stop:265 length:147 start_codon:yes stop_codon:yes gene_type:complete
MLIATHPKKRYYFASPFGNLKERQLIFRVKNMATAIAVKSPRLPTKSA